MKNPHAHRLDFIVAQFRPVLLRDQFLTTNSIDQSERGLDVIGISTGRLSGHRSRPHRRDTLFHLPREVRRDAEHPLDHHQLPPVVHLVLLGRDQHFEPRFHSRLHPFRVLDLLTQKGLRSAFQNLGVLLAFDAQEFQYLRLCARRFYFCLKLVPKPEEIEANQRAAVLDRMDLLWDPRHHCNVDQRLPYRAASRRRRTLYFSSGISSAIVIVLLRTVRSDCASSLAP